MTAADPEPPPIDDPMVGLDPWTAGYIRFRQFLQSGDRTEAEAEELAHEIRRTLPHPDPPRLIGIAIQADITLVEMGAPDSPMTAYVAKLWTPPSTEEE